MRGQLRSESITARDGTPVDVDMWMPDSYHNASPDDKDAICNGCGPQGWLSFLSRRMPRVSRFRQRATSMTGCMSSPSPS